MTREGRFRNAGYLAALQGKPCVAPPVCGSAYRGAWEGGWRSGIRDAKPVGAQVCTACGQHRREHERGTLRCAAGTVFAAPICGACDKHEVDAAGETCGVCQEETI